MEKEDIINFISVHKAEFQQKYGVNKIGLFGSYARGETFEGSDIDIVVELKNRICSVLLVSNRPLKRLSAVKLTL